MPLEQSEPYHHSDRGKRPHALLSNKRLSEMFAEHDARFSEDPLASMNLIEELIREHYIRQKENRVEPSKDDRLTEYEVMNQPVDEDFQDFYRSDDVFEQTWVLIKEQKYPPGDSRWAEPDPRRGAPIECVECGNTFPHEIGGFELPESQGEGKGVCAECFTIQSEGPPEQVFPSEFAPGLGNLGHQDLTTGEPMVFEQAWGITKMPLVRDSIKELDSTPGSFNFPPYVAIFRDKEGKEYPIEAREDQTYNINVFDPDTDKRLAYGNFRPWDRIQASDVKTLDPDNRRKGMMTAIYDLMNEIARTKGKRLKSDAGNLSDSSAPFWAKALGLPYEGYTEFQTKHRGQGFEWPEEGVYE